LPLAPGATFRGGTALGPGRIIARAPGNPWGRPRATGSLRGLRRQREDGAPGGNKKPAGAGGTGCPASKSRPFRLIFFHTACGDAGPGPGGPTGGGGGTEDGVQGSPLDRAGTGRFVSKTGPLAGGGGGGTPGPRRSGFRPKPFGFQWKGGARPCRKNQGRRGGGGAWGGGGRRRCFETPTRRGLSGRGGGSAPWPRTSRTPHRHWGPRLPSGRWGPGLG